MCFLALMAIPSAAVPVTTNVDSAASPQHDEPSGPGTRMAQPPVMPGAVLDAAVAGAPQPAASDAATSASAMAADLIRDADAAEQAASESPKPSGRGAPRQASKTTPKAQPGRTDEWDVKAAGKAAWDWLKDHAFWRRGDGEQTTEGEVTPAHDPWTQTSLPGEGRVSTALPTGAIGASPYQGVNSSPPDAGARAAKNETGSNLVREAVQLARDIMEHPMTWLVMGLIVVGWIAVTKMDRRPKE